MVVAQCVWLSFASAAVRGYWQLYESGGSMCTQAHSDSAEYLIKPTSETTFSPTSNRCCLIWKPSPTKSNKCDHVESCGNQGNTVLTSWTGVGMLRGYLMELDIYRLSATSLLPQLFIFFVPLGFSLSLSW